MIRLIADENFPLSIEQVRSLGLEINRWAGERVSDKQLLMECEQIGAHGVLFLGLQALVGSHLPSVARAHRLYLAATVETDPFAAVRTVGNLIGPLEREVAAGVAHAIYARELRLLEEVLGGN